MDCVAKVDFVNTEKSARMGMSPSVLYQLTGINGTPESVREYFAIGKVFNVGYGHHDRNGHRCGDHLMQVSHVFVLRQDERTEAFCRYLYDRYGFDHGEHFTEEEWEKFNNN